MISFIFAMDRNRLIGQNNQLPWHLPADLKYFKNMTMGHKIVMGRKTFESIGRPLPGRENIVLSTNRHFHPEGCQVFYSMDEFLTFANKHQEEEIFVIGGANIFEKLLPYADRLYITEIDEQFTGDTYFPPFNLEEWKKISSIEGTVDKKNIYPHRFVIYERF
ncbi:dihydrofolate reductase [Bacillus alveayuensis]|jgi:dihydrofolate reductase|uniref:Dihydrofolate reductase n=1 Tax=Aeribacillus alveayuensis TaxID=279215 RepID=A0ABT9VPG7_9BACI|nr:dihydrofolate reductase [Bacillus alveayuensis]MDQ0162784.1 dihydrofolate reductase [Bacillus alveayuensis]